MNRMDYLKVLYERWGDLDAKLLAAVELGAKVSRDKETIALFLTLPNPRPGLPISRQWVWHYSRPDSPSDGMRPSFSGGWDLDKKLQEGHFTLTKWSASGMSSQRLEYNMEPHGPLLIG